MRHNGGTCNATRVVRTAERRPCVVGVGAPDEGLGRAGPGAEVYLKALPASKASPLRCTRSSRASGSPLARGRRNPAFSLRRLAEAQQNLANLLRRLGRR